MNEQDKSYLNIISIFYIVLGCLMLPLSLLPLVHIAVGAMVVVAPHTGHGNEAMPILFGGIFIVFGLIIMLTFLAIAICMIYTGVCIKRRTKYIFCMVISAIACTFAPLGTILGVFSIILLCKPEIKADFEANAETFSVPQNDPDSAEYRRD